MAMALHVNGEARISCDVGSSTPGHYADLGVSLDGVDIILRPMFEEVFTDTFGPKVPFDLQSFLGDALIRAVLMFYDDAVLRNIVGPQFVRGSSNTEGAMGNAGALVGANSNFYGVKITAPYSPEVAWTFPKCQVYDQTTFKIGTKRTGVDITFRALPYTGAAGTTNNTAVLYTRP